MSEFSHFPNFRLVKIVGFCHFVIFKQVTIVIFTNFGELMLLFT